jgi:hypothetical protein
MKSKVLNAYYKKYIDEFISNNKRQKTILPGINSYHRYLIHTYCDANNLAHTTITYGTKKRLTCPYCKSATLRKQDYDDYEEELRCIICKEACVITWKIEGKILKKFMESSPNKAIQISKQCKFPRDK